MKVRINKPSLYIFINGVLTKKKCPKCALYLSLDHINSDGYKHRKELNLKRGNSIVMYRWIIEHPDEARNRLQILCMNAQWMKRRFNAELEGGGKGFIVVSQEEVKT